MFHFFEILNLGGGAVSPIPLATYLLFCDHGWAEVDNFRSDRRRKFWRYHLRKTGKSGRWKKTRNSPEHRKGKKFCTSLFGTSLVSFVLLKKLLSKVWNKFFTFIFIQLTKIHAVTFFNLNMFFFPDLKILYQPICQFLNTFF